MFNLSGGELGLIFGAAVFAVLFFGAVSYGIYRVFKIMEEADEATLSKEKKHKQ